MRNGFIFGIVLGMGVLIELLIITPLYEKNLALFDYKSEHNIVMLVSDIIGKVANFVWIEEADWKDFESEILNLATGTLVYTMASLCVIIFVLLTICYLLFYTISFFIGALIGAIVGLVVVSLVSLFCVLGHNPVPEHLPLIRAIVVNSGIITIYLMHVLLVGIIFALIASRFEKRRNTEGDNEMNKKKWDTDLPVTTNRNFMAPYTGNLKDLQIDIPRYDSNKGYVGTALSKLIEGLKIGSYNKELERRAETYTALDRCLNALYGAAVSYNKLMALEEYEAIERGRRNLELLSIELQREIMIQAHQYQLEYNMLIHWNRMAEEELEFLKLKKQQAEVFFPQDAGRKKDNKIGKIEEIRDRCLSLYEMIDNIGERFKDNPIKKGEVVDTFMRELVEEGVIGDAN